MEKPRSMHLRNCVRDVFEPLPSRLEGGGGGPGCSLAALSRLGGSQWRAADTRLQEHTADGCPSRANASLIWHSWAPGLCSQLTLVRDDLRTCQPTSWRSLSSPALFILFSSFTFQFHPGVLLQVSMLFKMLKWNHYPQIPLDFKISRFYIPVLKQANCQLYVDSLVFVIFKILGTGIINYC